MIPKIVTVFCALLSTSWSPQICLSLTENQTSERTTTAIDLNDLENSESIHLNVQFPSGMAAHLPVDSGAIMTVVGSLYAHRNPLDFKCHEDLIVLVDGVYTSEGLPPALFICFTNLSFGLTEVEAIVQVPSYGDFSFITNGLLGFDVMMTAKMKMDLEEQTLSFRNGNFSTTLKRERVKRQMAMVGIDRSDLVSYDRLPSNISSSRDRAIALGQVLRVKAGEMGSHFKF